MCGRFDIDRLTFQGKEILSRLLGVFSIMNPNASEFKFNVTASEWKPPSAAPVDSLTAPVGARAATPTRARMAATPTTQEPTPTAIPAPVRAITPPPPATSGNENILNTYIIISYISYLIKSISYLSINLSIYYECTYTSRRRCW